jgi:DNA-directed RNA polymerase subunit M/transcription elongation factor TFIIS
MYESVYGSLHPLQVSEKCSACGHLEAYYEEKQVAGTVSTVYSKLNCLQPQMRSADEGSTILYTVRHSAVHSPSLMNSYIDFQCVSCKHGWRVNN